MGSLSDSSTVWRTGWRGVARPDFLFSNVHFSFTDEIPLFSSKYHPPSVWYKGRKAGFRSWILAPLLLMALLGQAQTISVPLGTAAQFGLLSGGTLTADTVSDAHVAGKAGAATALIGPVQTSGTAESSAVTAALTHLTAARAYCSGLSAAPLTAPLNGQTLTGGAYTLSGNVTFGAGNPLVLQGTDTTVFVINVTGDLTLTAGAQVWLTGRIAPQNIVWNVSGNLTSADYTVLPGVVMTGGNITASGIWAATSALLSTGDLTLTQVRFAPAEMGSTFFGVDALLPPPDCANPTTASTGSCPNLAFNGDFETPDPALAGGLPTGNANICNRSPGPRYITTKELTGWSAATWGTPDWFKSGGATGVAGVPTNTYSPGAISTPTHGGGAYTGLFACSDFLPPTGPAIPGREYLMQRLPIPTGQTTPLMLGLDYYVEFFSRLAPTSAYTVPNLGLAIFTTDPYKDQWTGILPQPGSTAPVIPLISAHDQDFNKVNVWSRTAGAFLATGTEKYIAIGNFGSENPSQIPGSSPSGFTMDSYQYIDDVQILPFPLPVITCGTLNGQRNIELAVGCPLPASSGALYKWTWTDPCQTIRSTAGGTSTCPPSPLSPLSHVVESTNPVFYPPYPYAASYTLTVRVPIPGTNPVQYYVGAPHSVFSNTVFAFTIDETMPAAQNITASQTWNADMTIRGTITVWPNVTLTINNHAVIRFDDTFRQTVVPSNQPAYSPTQIFTRNALETRILVKPGGHLIITDGAVLTSLIDPVPGPVPPICHNPVMWDGVTVEGSGTGTGTSTATAQNSTNQGVLDINEAGTISHARYGVTAGTAAYTYKSIQVGATPPPAGSYQGWLLAPTAGKGGAIVTGNMGRFVDCYFGVSFATYRRSDATGQPQNNLSRFDDCLIQGTQVLADPEYRDLSSGIWTRIGTRRGVWLSSTNTVTFVGNTFDGFDGVPPLLRGWGMFVFQSGADVQSAGYTSGDHWQPIRPNIFQDWNVGINGQGSFDPVLAKVRGNVFTNNYWGAQFGNANRVDCHYNLFFVGGPSMAVSGQDQPVGLYYTASAYTTPEENLFVPHPLSNASTLTVGLRFESTRNAAISTATTEPRTAQAYRNTFTGIEPTYVYSSADPVRSHLWQPSGSSNGYTYLYTGLYAFNDNTNVTFRCNTFNNRKPSVSSSSCGNYPSSDVQVFGGTVATQGNCDGSATGTPNNTFTDNTNIPATNKRYHIYLRCGSQGTSGGTPFTWYPTDAGMRPTDCTTTELPLVVSCGNTVGLDGCPAHDESVDLETLQARLAQEPAGSDERAMLLNELVGELVTTENVAHGLDTAIALLEREQSPAYDEYLLQLQSLREEASMAAGGNGQRHTLLQASAPWRKAAPVAVDLRRSAANPTAGRAVTNYLYRVRDLLLPLGTDSARTVAVMTDGSLRAELQRMAEDSLTRGYLAARAAMNQYGGTHYRLTEWEDAEGDGADLGRSAGPVEPTPPTAFLVLTPNPSTGHVRVGYGLPRTAQQVAVRVYDEWGQPCGEHRLTAESLAEGVTLRLRPGLYQCVLEADGQVVAKERLLIIH